jgi:hypothetical protein
METKMALFDDLLKGNAVTGLAVGAAAMVLGPTLFPALGRFLRPAAKTVIKGGMVVYRETLAGIGELTTSLVEEARSELEQSGREQSPGDGPARAAPAHRESAREKR